jgi:hypothetical protein
MHEMFLIFNSVANGPMHKQLDAQQIGWTLKMIDVQIVLELHTFLVRP